MVSKEKYPIIFSRQHGVIVLLSFKFFSQNAEFKRVFGHVTYLEKLRAVIFDG